MPGGVFVDCTPCSGADPTAGAARLTEQPVARCDDHPVDATTVVALAGIGATLLAGVAGPLLVERMRRESERRGHLLLRRLDVYADLLRATARLADNAIDWAFQPLAELRETDDEELNRLVSQVRVVASRSVHEQLTDLTRRMSAFYRVLFPARDHHQRIRDAGQVDDAQSVQLRSALAAAADEIVTLHKRLEATVRDEVGP